MIGPEIRDTVNIALSAMILAALLAFISFVMTVSYNISSTYNTEVYAEESLASYYEFSNFDGSQKLSGLDIISAIREYSNSPIQIRVDVDGANKVYSKASATLDKDSVSIETLKCLYYTPNSGSPGCTLGSMDYVYKAVLLYGHTDILAIDPTTYVKPSVFDQGVTGIIFYKIAP